MTEKKMTVCCIAYSYLIDHGDESKKQMAQKNVS